MNMQSLPNNSDEYRCEFCERSFRTERTLLAHVCEQKKRSQERTDPVGQLAFMSYQRFYQLTQGGKERTWDQFAKSPYYQAFIKFARYMRQVDAVNPLLFIDWVIKQQVKLDHWARDTTYTKYLLEYIKSEGADSAIERSFTTMQKWADEQSSSFEHYLRYANPNRIATDLSNGRVSPWILWATKSGRELLGKLNEDQLNVIAGVIDPDHWKRRIKDWPVDMETVKYACTAAGIE
jgi:hypothetical protein